MGSRHRLRDAAWLGVEWWIPVKFGRLAAVCLAVGISVNSGVNKAPIRA